MFRAIATLLLMAHVAAFAAPAMTEAGTPETVRVSHCAPSVSQVGASVIQASQDKDCDACEMPDCLGTASCAQATVAIVSMSSIDIIPAGELVSPHEGSRVAANLLHTPLPPPPKP